MNFTGEIEKLVYQEYLELKSSDNQEKIRYFERNISEIMHLPFSISAEIQCDCVMAYFEVGAYFKYLEKVDPLIQLVISENIFEVKEKNIFEELLFRKAASLFNIVEYDKAEYVFSELLKINPDNTIYKKAYAKCSVDKLRYEGQKFRGATIFLFILTGLIIGIELLCVRPFHSSAIPAVEITRNLVFVLAICSFLFQEFRIRFLTNKSIHKHTTS